MAEQPFTHPRWGPDSLGPQLVSSPPFYSATAQGPVRRAALHDPDGQLLGHVWTDDLEAAGFLPDEKAGSEGVRASGYVWVLMSASYELDVPAGELLDPVMYAPTYELRA